jgi:uncharacterized protein (TIGR02466 family)
MHSNSSIKHWFMTPIYSTQLETTDKNTYLANKAIHLKNSFEVNNSDWRCPTFNTLNLYDWHADNDPIIIDLIDLCKQEVYKFSQSFGVKLNLDQLYCKDFWFNIAEENEYQEYHQHTDSHFSLSYYVQTPNNCGNIVFRSFESMFDMAVLPIKNEDLTELSFKTCSYTPKESMLVIFRSNLLHMVEQNLSKEPRISISMNFNFRK